MPKAQGVHGCDRKCGWKCMLDPAGEGRCMSMLELHSQKFYSPKCTRVIFFKKNKINKINKNIFFKKGESDHITSLLYTLQRPPFALGYS